MPDDEELQMPPKKCSLLGRGHGVNPIPGRRSAFVRGQAYRLIAASGTVVTVGLADEIIEFRNHRPGDLREWIGTGVEVLGSGLLRVDGSRLVSILSSDEEWEPCSSSSFSSSSSGGI
jgi:hypothetical protein